MKAVHVAATLLGLCVGAMIIFLAITVAAQSQALGA